MKKPNKRFKSRTLRVLFHLLPPRIKRLMFLSSLAGKIAGEKQMDRETLLKFQERFKLCQDPNAIELGLALNEKLWATRPIDALVCPVNLEIQNTEQDLTRIARRIVAIMPCWMVYGTTITKIVADTRELLAARNDLFHVPVQTH